MVYTKKKETEKTKLSILTSLFGGYPLIRRSTDPSVYNSTHVLGS